MNKGKIIITGAAGFIGSNLTTRLLDNGYFVTGIDNFSYGRKQNIEHLAGNKQFRFIEGDLLDYQTLAPTEGSIVIHLASQKIPRYTNSLRTIEENNDITNNVIKKCLAEGSRLIFASTSDVYGKNPDIPYSEESNMVLGPTKIKRWAYAVSKIFSEHKIIAYSEASDLKYTILRFFGAYGPNQNLTWWGGPQSVFIEKALQNEAIELHGDGKQTRTFTYIDDTVQGIIKCMESEKAINEVFNIAAEPKLEITIEDLAILIWKLIRPGDSKPLINYIPYATFGNYEDVRRRVPDINKIKSLLGFQPVYDLEEGLIKTIEWQKKQYA
jgi:UDP-glucose 4-epimerase